MKYTTNTPNPDWSKFKFYQHLNASEDLLHGGWVLHFMAPTGGGDEYDDYLRCQTVDCRFARIRPLTQKSYEPFTSKYRNWYNLTFPLLQVDINKEYDGSMEYDQLPAEIRQVCNIAEKHLLIDNVFEKFVYDKSRRFAHEWNTFTRVEKDKLLLQFIDSKKADDENLRQHLPQAEFDPYYKAK